MSMLENITRGRESKPPRLFIYGQEGVGKSTVGAAAPNPIFVQTEDGLGEIDTAKFPLAKNLNDVLAALTALREEPHDFQTVVLDSADWLERLIWDQVCAEFGVPPSRRRTAATARATSTPSATGARWSRC